jgi:hypothetical protein
MADTKQEQNIQFLYSVLTVNGNPTVIVPLQSVFPVH